MRSPTFLACVAACAALASCVTETAPDQPSASQSGYAVPPEAQSEMQPASAFRTNDAAIEIIKQSEGLRLEAYAVGGQWLIGYGHSRTAKAGMRINEDEAEALLREDLADCEQAVANLTCHREHVGRAFVSLLQSWRGRLCRHIGRQRPE